MAVLPTLSIVDLHRLRRHEEVDPLRVNRLAERVAAEGIQVNPMVCVEVESGELVVLDGATRTETLRQMGLDHAAVQIVDSSSVILETWHHVVLDCDTDALTAEIESREGLALDEDSGTPRIHMTGRISSVLASGISLNAALSLLVDAYIGRWAVSRITEPDPHAVAARFPDWSALIEFPTLTVEDVMKAALGDDHLPAGVTRFLIPDRALRLNLDLEVLVRDASREEKQAELDRVLGERFREGRVRRYEESVFVMDD